MVTLSAAKPRAGTVRLRMRGRFLAGMILVLQLLSMGLLIVVVPGAPLPQVAMVGVALSLMAINGVLGRQVELSALDRLPRVSSAFAAATGAVASGYALGGRADAALAVLEIGPLALLTSWVVLAASYGVGVAARRRGLARDRVVIVGAGQVADLIETALAARPEYGLHVVGYIAAVSGERVSPRRSPHLGAPEDLVGIVRAQDADVVIVAYSLTPESQLLAPLRELAASRKQVLVVPRFFEDLDRRQMVGGIWGIPLQRLPMPTAGRTRALIKRGIDVVVAGAAFVLLLPVMAVIAVAITRETGGRLLFRQERVGQGERPITIIKFQTMRPASDIEADTRWSISRDERLGPVGRFLRRTSLDELPQLWNVIRGDMSLVGPRPERPHFVEQFKSSIPGYGARHRVQVGLTGWAQVHELRGDSSIEERVRFDNAYAASWSPWEDVKILIQTVPEVIKGNGG